MSPSEIKRAFCCITNDVFIILNDMTHTTSADCRIQRCATSIKLGCSVGFGLLRCSVRTEIIIDYARQTGKWP